MKINFLASGIFKSGGMKIIYEYCNRLTLKGHDVILYYPSFEYNFYNGNIGSIFSPKPVYNAIYNFKNRKNKEAISFVRNFKLQQVPFLKNHFLRDADVSIATIWHTSYSLAELNISKGRKFYFVQDYEIWNADKSKVDNSYLLSIPIITTSIYLRDLLKKQFQRESFVIPYGFDFKFLNNEEKKYFKKVKNISFIDYKLEKKNVDMCIEACKRLNEQHKNVNFISFGLDRFHDLPDFIHFIKNPNEAQIRDIFFDTDIFLFSSFTEGFAMPPAEAMASKCAVITTPVGFIPEFIVHKESAMIVNPENFSTMTKAANLLLENEELLIKISENGYNAVLNKFDWSNSVDKFEEIISKE
ncbi:MAG: glycosyltransferase family 4 protein [Ignavibacteria bacterium]